MVAIDQTNVFNFGTNLDDTGGALEFEILDQRDCIAILQDVAGSVLEHLGGFDLCQCLLRPLVRTFGANKILTIFVGEFRLAFGAIGEGHVFGGEFQQT